MTHWINEWRHEYDAIIEAGTATSTRRAHRRDEDYFFAWHELATGRRPGYPIPKESVIRFVLDHLGSMDPSVDEALVERRLKRRQGSLAVPTVRRYLGSLSVAHDALGVENPCRQPQVRLLLKRAGRATRSGKKRRKAAATLDVLHQLLATCDSGLRGARDRAIMLVAFASGGRRRSELAALLLEDLQQVPGGYLLRLRRSKTDQDGEGRDVPVAGPAAKALRVWLKASGITEGRLFRGISRHGHMAATLSGHAICKMVKERARLAGLDAAKYGAHSLRSGFITEAGRQGVAIGEAMSLSGHENLVVAQGYYRAGELLGNRAANLLSPYMK